MSLTVTLGVKGSPELQLAVPTIAMISLLLNWLWGSLSSPWSNLEISESLELLVSMHIHVFSRGIFLGSNSICFSNVSSPKEPLASRICLFTSKDGCICSVALNLVWLQLVRISFSCQTGINASLEYLILS